VMTEEVVEMKDGKRKTSKRKTFPSYVVVEMDLNNETRHLVQNVPGVTRFVGSGAREVPLKENAVRRLLGQMETSKTRPATPAPPVGPDLGQHGINIMEFCKQFNARTQAQAGLVIPVIITVYNDRTFTFITKTPPAAILLKKAAGIEKASGVPNRNKVGKV